MAMHARLGASPRVIAMRAEASTAIMSRGSLGQAVLPIKEVLAVAVTRRSAGGADCLEQLLRTLKSHFDLAGTRRNVRDGVRLASRFRPPDQVGQLVLCVGGGNMHWITLAFLLGWTVSPCRRNCGRWV